MTYSDTDLRERALWLAVRSYDRGVAAEKILARAAVFADFLRNAEQPPSEPAQPEPQHDTAAQRLADADYRGYER